jgi:hypothetical protein
MGWVRRVGELGGWVAGEVDGFGGWVVWVWPGGGGMGLQLRDTRKSCCAQRRPEKNSTPTHARTRACANAHDCTYTVQDLYNSYNARLYTVQDLYNSLFTLLPRSRQLAPTPTSPPGSPDQKHARPLGGGGRGWQLRQQGQRRGDADATWGCFGGGGACSRRLGLRVGLGVAISRGWRRGGRLFERGPPSSIKVRHDKAHPPSPPPTHLPV